MKRENARNNRQKQNVSRRDARSKIILMCLCIALLGTATFAWFTVSNTPRVNNLALVAATTGDLKIADAEAGPYGDELDLATGSGGNMSNVELNPVTTQNGRDFYAPVYTESTVTGVENIPEGELNTNYVYEKTFWLRAETNSSSVRRNRRFDVYFVGIRSEGGGTFVENASSSDWAASAVRISFTLDDGTTFIYEPNADSNVNGERAVNGLPGSYGGYSTIQQSSNRRFNNSNDNNSEKLFTIPENTPTRVVMRVWIEGTDNDCVNEISASDILGQIQFISKEAAQ